MVKVPVGVGVLELDTGATVIVMVSVTPAAGEVVCAESVVLEGVRDEEGGVGHAISKL
jgi:hypothetical protein